MVEESSWNVFFLEPRTGSGFSRLPFWGSGVGPGAGPAAARAADHPRRDRVDGDCDGSAAAGFQS